jgi:type IV conjugative transfer system protein TraE
MKKELYFDIRTKLFKENRLLKFVITALSITTIVLAISFSISSKKVTIEILPSVFNDKIVIGNHSINESGAKDFTRKAFDLFLNHTPKSAPNKFDELLLMIHTNNYDAIKEMLDKNLATIQRLGIVSAFHIEKLELDGKNNTIIASGLRTKTSFGNKLDRKEHISEHWKLRYQIIDHNFKVVKFWKDE